jgi:Arabinose efflux permease
LTVVIQQIDRNLPNVLMEPLKQEFQLTDSHLGLLAGTMFAMSYFVAGVPLGRLADRTNRRNLLAALLTIWSTLTALSAFAGSFLALAIARIGIGAAESGTIPAAMSMVSDVVPEQRRATSSGLIYGAAMFGGFVSYLLGGLVAENWGWRAAFLMAGIPGLILAALLILVAKEPLRTTGELAVSHRGNVWHDMGQLLFHRVLGPLYVGATLCTLVASAIGAWAVSLLVRVHGLTLPEAGLAAALAMGLCGAAGTSLMGLAADWAGRQSAGHVLRVPAVGAAILTLSGWAFATGETVYGAIAGLCLAGFMSQAHAGAIVGTISRVAPPEIRALAFALFSVVGSVIGLAIGPYLVGVLSDASTAAQPLPAAIVAILPIMVAPIALFLLAAQRLDRPLVSEQTR